MKPADKRRGGWLALGLVGLVLAGWWFGTPRYEGHSLAYWFNEFHRTSQGQRQPRARHVQRAIQAFGTNAVPYLLELSFNEDYRPWDVRLWSQLTARIHGLNRAGPEAFREYLNARERAQFDPADDASMWFWYLRPPTALVLPSLTNRLQDPRLPIRARAIMLLGCLDATALPHLRPFFTNQDANVRSFAFAALARLDTNAAGAVPDLIVALDDPVLSHFVPAQILHRIGGPARPALPRLRQVWQSETNFDALAASIQIGDEDWGKDALRQSLQPQADPGLRLWALRYLSGQHFLGIPYQLPPITDGKFLLPELSQALQDSDAEVRSPALAALWRLHLDTTGLKPWLEDKLRQPWPTAINTTAEWSECMMASGLLLQLDPAHPAALRFLAARLDDFQAREAVDLLARMDPPSPPALEILQRASLHKDRAVREQAIEAIGEFR